MCMYVYKRIYIQDIPCTHIYTHGDPKVHTDKKTDRLTWFLVDPVAKLALTRNRVTRPIFFTRIIVFWLRNWHSARYTN